MFQRAAGPRRQRNQTQPTSPPLPGGPAGYPSTPDSSSHLQPASSTACASAPGASYSQGYYNEPSREWAAEQAPHPEQEPYRYEGYDGEPAAPYGEVPYRYEQDYRSPPYDYRGPPGGFDHYGDPPPPHPQISKSAGAIADEMKAQHELNSTIGSIVLSGVDLVLHIAVAIWVQLNYHNEHQLFWAFIVLGLIGNLIGIVVYVARNVGAEPPEVGPPVPRAEPAADGALPWADGMKKDGELMGASKQQVPYGAP